MGRTSRRVVVLVAAAGLAAAACSGDDEADAGPIERGLALLPEDAVREIRDDGYEILVADFRALSEAAGLDEPEAGRDPDDVADWLVELSIGDRDDDEVSPTALLPQSLQQLDAIDDFDAILGLDVGAVESFAAILRPPREFTAFSGDIGFPAADLDDGVGVLGDGDEGDLDFENVSGFNRIGKVLQLGEREGAVAFGDSAELVEEWVTEDASLATDDELVAVARAVDAAGAVSAVLFQSDFDVAEAVVFSPPDAAEEIMDAVVITESFDLVAIGTTVVDDEVGNVVAYRFDDEDEAADAVGDVEAVWTDAELLTLGTTIDELYDVVAVEQEGAVVVVMLEPLDGRPAGALANLLFRLDVPFMHD